jgi:hypothetical protein
MLRIVNRSSDAQPAHAAVAAGAGAAPAPDARAASAARRRPVRRPEDAPPPCPRSRRLLVPTVLARAVAWGVLFAAVASPTGAVLLDFEGVGEKQVGDFYGGGVGGGGPTRDYGIVFGDGAFGAIDSDAGGLFSLANEPSPNTTVLILGDESECYVTVLGGFTALAFQYTSDKDATVTVHAGPNMTGTILGTFALPAVGACPSDCGDPTGRFGIWRNLTAPFSGVARSVSFSVGINIFFVDDMVIELVPTQAPTKVPTQAPTKVPTQAPTKVPTQVPTSVPTKAPTKLPTRRPTMAPTKRPTRFPTAPPTRRCARRGMKGTKRCMKA